MTDRELNLLDVATTANNQRKKTNERQKPICTRYELCEARSCAKLQGLLSMMVDRVVNDVRIENFFLFDIYHFGARNGDNAKSVNVSACELLATLLLSKPLSSFSCQWQIQLLGIRWNELSRAPASVCLSIAD